MRRVFKAIFPSMDYVLVFVGAIIGTTMFMVIYQSNVWLGLLLGIGFFALVAWESVRDILKGDDPKWDEWV